MNKIEIEIKGLPNSGKTTLLVEIEKALRSAGFTNVNLKTDSSIYSLLDSEAQAERLSSVTGNVEVTIKETNVRKSEYANY